MRRGIKEVHSSSIGGGLEGGGVTGTRPKVEKRLHTEPREASVVGSFRLGWLIGVTIALPGLKRT